MMKHPIALQTAGRRLLGTSVKIALVLFGILIALFLIELMARLLGTPFEPRGGFECDRMVGWRGQPGASTFLNIDGHQNKVVWNSRGLHDREHSIEKQEGVFRILMLGDSFVEAMQVEETQSSHHLLEDILNSQAPPGVRFEVLSAGMGGWGPNQELTYFQSEGRMYAPDLVLGLWVPANDLEDILPDSRLTYAGINCYAPYFAICNGKFDPEPWFSAPGIPPTWKTCSTGKKALTSVLNRLYYSSRLYQRLEPVLTKGYHRIEYSQPYAPWLEHMQTDEALDYSYQLTAGIYSQLAEEANQINAQTALIIVPPKQTVYAETDPALRDEMQRTIQDAGGNGPINPTLPNQRFSSLMKTKGLPVLDLHPYFVAQLKSGEELYWKIDSHWNIAGNRLAAEVITQWLIDEKLVPTAH